MRLENKTSTLKTLLSFVMWTNLMPRLYFMHSLDERTQQIN